MANTYSPSKRALSVNEFCRDYGIGKTSAYSEMAEGRLKSVTCGRRRLIPCEFAEAWLAAKTGEAA